MEPASASPPPASSSSEPARPDDAATGAEEVAEPETAAAPAPVTRASRGSERRPRDMILSLAVLLVPIAILLVIYRTLFDGDAPITVDPVPTIQEAQQAKLFPVAAPQGLGDDWSVASAKFSRAANGATLRIGYVDPDKDPIQLVESSIPTDTLLPAEITKQAKPVGTFRSAQGVWRLFDGRPGEKALVMADQTRTIIVVGKADVDSLEKLAGSLR